MKKETGRKRSLPRRLRGKQGGFGALWSPKKSAPARDHHAECWQCLMHVTGDRSSGERTLMASTHRALEAALKAEEVSAEAP